MRTDGRFLLAAVVAALVLVSCSSGGTSSARDGATGAASSGYAGTRTCSYADRDRCYDLSVMGQAYCLVQQVRGLYRDGSLPEATVPSWADPGTVDRAPRLVDFRAPGGTSFDEVSDRLDAFVAAQDLSLDDRHERRCLDGLDQRTVEDTEGPRPTS